MSALYRHGISLATLAAMIWASGCGVVADTKPQEPAQEEQHDHDHDHDHEDDHDHDHEHEDDHDHGEEGTPGGIPLSAAARENLGITFAKVEQRVVSAVRSLPGSFELLPNARQEYRAPLRGRIAWHVAQFDPVQQGALLFTLDSSEWRQIQHEAVEAEGDIAMAQAALEVARAQRAETLGILGKQRERLATLGELKARNAPLEAEVTALQGSIPRHDAEIRAREAALAEAREHYASRLAILSSVTGISIEELDAHPGGVAAWRGIRSIEARAQRPGVLEVMAVSDGAWVESGDLVASVLDPAAIRFVAQAPQAEAALFVQGQQARIVPQKGGAAAPQEIMTGLLVPGLTVDSATRTLPLYVTPDALVPWARAGVPAHLEIVDDPDAPQRLAIPEAALIQDGLDFIFFRRDPKNQDQVLRLVADLGARDGQWAEIRSGLKAGDEVVLDGVYALKLNASEQQTPDGYHYHADGSLHKDH
ncbi:MAG: hypothetical protein RLZZ303_1413 [Candidatus Hydrogenedentota bacterium]|jgi:predicted deacylase